MPKLKSQEEVAEIFKNKGCTLIGEYVLFRIAIEYICKCGKHAKISLSTVMEERWIGCRECSLERTKKEKLEKRSSEKELEEKDYEECSSRKRGICGRNCTTCKPNSFASHEKSEFWSKKNLLLPFQVALNCNLAFWFICGVCKHEFEKTIYNITKKEGQWCGYCSHFLCEKEECAVCFKRSFASHPKATFWDYEKNVENPRQVRICSNKHYFFKCDECGHELFVPLNLVSFGSWCKYCSGKELCSDYECDWCYRNSFEVNERAKYWSKLNSFSPREMFEHSNKKALFDCKTCFHTFSASLNKIADGGWCSYCYGNKLCDIPECMWCKYHSFASHEKAEFWSENNILSPRNVRLCCNTKFLFFCNRCDNEFSKTPGSVFSGGWCPFCKKKTEAKVLDFLGTNYPSVIYQPRFDWCISESSEIKLPFDFCVGKIIIEIDGRQHFEQVMNWQSPEETQKRDKYKEEKAKENGYSVVRFNQREIWEDKIDWKKMMVEILG